MDNLTSSNRIIFEEALNGLGELCSNQSKWFFSNVVYRLDKAMDDRIDVASEKAGINLDILFHKYGSLQDVFGFVNERTTSLIAMREKIAPYYVIELALEEALKDLEVSNKGKKEAEKEAFFYDEKYDKSYDDEEIPILRRKIDLLNRKIRDCRSSSKINEKYIKSFERKINGKTFILSDCLHELRMMHLNGSYNPSFVRYTGLLDEYVDAHNDFLGLFLSIVNEQIDSYRETLSGNNNYCDDYQSGENPYLTILRIMAVDGVHLKFFISPTEMYDKNARVDYTLLPEGVSFVRDCIKKEFHIENEPNARDYQIALQVLQTKPYDISELTFQGTEIIRNSKSLGKK